MAHEVCGAPVKILPDGVVMHGGGRGHKQVPDGMGERDNAIALEEDHAQAVNQAPAGELVKSLRVVLWAEEAERKCGCYGGDKLQRVTAAPALPPRQ